MLNNIEQSRAIQNLVEESEERDEDYEKERSQFNDLHFFSLQINSPKKKNNNLEFLQKERQREIARKDSPKSTSVTNDKLQHINQYKSNLISKEKSKFLSEESRVTQKISNKKFLPKIPVLSFQNLIPSQIISKNHFETNESYDSFEKLKVKIEDVMKPNKKVNLLNIKRVEKKTSNLLFVENNLLFAENDKKETPIHSQRLRDSIKKKIEESQNRLNNLKENHIMTEKASIEDLLNRYDSNLKEKRSKSNPRLLNPIKRRTKSSPVVFSNDYTLEQIPMNKAFRVSVENKEKNSKSGWKSIKKWIAVDNVQRINSIVRFNRNDFFLHKM